MFREVECLDIRQRDALNESHQSFSLEVRQKVQCKCQHESIEERRITKAFEKEWKRVFQFM